MKFYNMGKKPLKHAVYNGKSIAIPEGATGVKIAFRQSHLRRFDEDCCKWVPMNVYLYKGKVVHA